MGNKLKIIGSVCLLVLCVFSMVINGINYESSNLKFIGTIISSLVAFADLFLALVPCIFVQLSITSSQIDPNRYSYKKNNFVDRKIIFDDITKQIALLDTNVENIMWIRLYGEDGIGKKTLVSKLFQKYRYPFNKFYFIDDVDGINILKLLNEKYPLNNTSDFNNTLYMHNLSKSRRTFVILESKSDDLNERATQLLTKWYEVNKNKLILIVLDRASEETIMNNQTVVFEYKLERLIKEDSKMLVSKLLKHNCIKSDDIVKAADGLPAAIKTLCNYYLKSKNHFEGTDWIEVFLRLKNDSQKAFLDFCILSMVKDNLSQCIAREIADNQTIEFFMSSKLLVKLSNNSISVPMWIIKMVLISEKYNEQIKHEIEYLIQKSILISDEKQQIIALIEKNSTDILDVLHCFSNNNSLIKIKEFYSKLNLTFNINDSLHKQIMIIIMETLLKLGEYGLFNNVFTKYAVPISTDLSSEDFKFNLLIADYYHLTSQYDKSNLIYYMLINTGLGKLNELEINFNLAHNFRHMGKLDISRQLFLKIEMATPLTANFILEQLPQGFQLIISRVIPSNRILLFPNCIRY